MNDQNQIALDQLAEFVRREMDKAGVPGVALGILHAGEVATAGFGVSNIDHPLTITDETLFQIGSITKTFTGLAVMRLIEMGKLELDASVQSYVADFKVSDEEASSKATVRHLLTHLGGWEGDVFLDTGQGDDALYKYMIAMADFQQLVPIGKVWSYNNAGFVLAGYLIEVVTGKSYQAAVKELVIDPLGLEHCYFDPGDVMTHRFVVGHRVEDGSALVVRPWPLTRASYPAGGIICHVKDLMSYAQFHLGKGTTRDGSQLLKKESLAEMQSPQVTIWKNILISVFSDQ